MYSLTNDWHEVLAGEANIAIIQADVVDVLPTLPDACLTAFLCDVPYGLEFMGADWDTPGKLLGAGGPGNLGGFADGNKPSLARQGPLMKVLRQYQAWVETWAAELLRASLPGAVGLSFAGGRTSHRLVCGIEECGWQIDDVLVYLYGNGPVKSMAMDKAIDRELGVERPVIEEVAMDVGMRGGSFHARWPKTRQVVKVTGPGSPEAEDWLGWGTGLRPGYEGILLVRAPRGGTYASCALQYGTGALNIAGTRLPTADGSPGRWPANVVLDCTCDDVVVEAFGGSRIRGGSPESTRVTYREGWERKPYVAPRGVAAIHSDPDCPCALLDDQSGQRQSSRSRPAEAAMGRVFQATFQVNRGARGYVDRGGASRFYFSGKASPTERDAGLENYFWRRLRPGFERVSGEEWEALPPDDRIVGNTHPTVKPLDVTRWLATMLLPPESWRGKAVLFVPFAGVMSEVIGAALAGWERIVAVEWSPVYAEMGRQRLEWWLDAIEKTGSRAPRDILAAMGRPDMAVTGQLALEL